MRPSIDITDHMRIVDLAAFKSAASFYNAYILVRRTNSSALNYIGVPGFTPKRLDCKFKTADHDFFHDRLRRQLTVGGLVVNPVMDEEFRKAFEPKKFLSAKKIWLNYSAQVVTRKFSHDQSGRANFAYMPGNLYSVDSKLDSDYYGCVIFSSNSLLSAATYIHSDYDLYGIVPADNPSENIRVTEQRFGFPHSRGRMFFDVQHFLNSRMQVAMIQHGSQEKFAEDMRDIIDVFYPDGTTVMCCDGVHEIKRLYSDLFQGRRLYSKSSSIKSWFGDWVVIV
jgi:hypothetical protein